MNITIVQGAFLPVPPVAGGAVEKLWFDLGREFARRGLAVTHIARRWPGQPHRNDADGVAYRRVAGFNYPRSSILAHVMDLTYSFRCFFAVRPSDVIVTNTLFLPLMLTLFKRRAIVYVSVHRYPQGQMALYQKVDRLQCVSTMIADAIRQQAPSVGPLVKVVPNYVSGILSADEVLESWTQRRKEVLFVGRLHPEKGIDLLLQGFADIPVERRVGWSLRVVGPHATRAGGGGEAFLAKLKSSAEALGIEVQWDSPVYDRDALDAVYRTGRIFVYPSTAAKGEAFPLAPLEAMGQGCPVVTSDLACFADYIRPGVNADNFSLGDATPAKASAALSKTLERLMFDEACQKAYSLAGLATAQEFTLERVADCFVDDFSALRKA